MLPVQGAHADILRESVIHILDCGDFAHFKYLFIVKTSDVIVKCVLIWVKVTTNK